MSSVVTIGFLDRTRACVQTAYALPLADDERREILIHVAFLTARTFAALPPQHQLSFGRVLRDWIGQGFDPCPVQLVSVDPGDGLPRFASSFQAPSREYALAMNGCGTGEDGIEHFLPMATAAFLRHLEATDHDPPELFKPALALCTAAAIHPLTIANHFQIAAASLPKVGPPIVQRSLEDQSGRPSTHPAGAQAEASLSAQHLRETRKTLIASAVLALLLVIAGVHYLSTRAPEAGHAPSPTVEVMAQPVPPKPSPVSEAPQVTPPSPPTVSSVAEPAPATANLAVDSTQQPSPSIPASPDVERRAEPIQAAKPVVTTSPSKQGEAYRRAVREIAENTVAQVEVMLGAVRRKDRKGAAMVEALDYGMRQIQTRQRRFDTLSPPRTFEESHHEIRQILLDLTGLAKELHDQSPMAPLTSRLASERLAQLHARLDGALDTVEGL